MLQHISGFQHYFVVNSETEIIPIVIYTSLPPHPLTKGEQKDFR